MALLQIAEPGQSSAPHQHKLSAGIDLGTTNSLVSSVRSGEATTLVQFHPLTTILLLIPFGGLVLVTSIKMGIGEFPAFFVNMDTPLILSHVHELLRTDIYPPDGGQIKAESMGKPSA